MLGRRTAGCEGTHGVFPRCDLACTPCYHSREANRVRTDGDHTEREVDRQMGLLRTLRGPGQNAQLIGGEVTLLGPEDHARALQAMHRYGRKPMPPALRTARVARAFARHPRALPGLGGWARRALRRAGGAAAVARQHPRAVTYVMHSFMDARAVRPAWEALRAGEEPDHPAVREAWERLQACSYTMAHAESGELVPACAQHSVLDPEENLRLQHELPLAPT